MASSNGSELLEKSIRRRFGIVGQQPYIRPMLRKSIELPPAVARAFVRNPKAFFVNHLSLRSFFVGAENLNT
jgi:hypothetical protein